MKKIKIIAIILLVSVLGSCELSDFGDRLQTNPNLLEPNQADPNFILNNIQLEMAELIQDLNRTTDEVMRYTWLNETYAAVANDSELNSEYTEMYAVLEDSKIIETAAAENDAFIFHRGMSKVLTAFMLTTMVDYLGDIPFSEANKGSEGIFEPKVDDDEEIYNKMLDRIDEAITDFNANTPTPTNDLFYDGNKDKWIQFANSLKLKLYVNMGNTSAINDLIAQDNFINVDEDFQFNYNTTQTEPDSRHPDFETGYPQGGASFGSFFGNTFLNYLLNGKSNADPRIRYYVYRQSITGPPTSSLEGCEGTGFNFCFIGNGYYGRDHGDLRTTGSDREFRVTYGLYPVGGAFDDNGAVFPAFNANHIGGAGITPIFLSSFVDFLRAEAVLRLGTNDDALLLLESGIRKSINKVINFKNAATGQPLAVSQTDIDEYVNEVITNFIAADANGKQNIVAEEFYLAAYGNSSEAYNLYRRTGLPNTLGESVTNKAIPFPRVFSYPNESILNNGNINQRPITTQVFWDKNPAGFIK